MVAATNAKTERWLMLWRRPKAVGKMHFFEPCETGVVNKQFVSPLIWNNLLSKTALGESYILIIDKHLEDKNHSLNVEGVYKMYIHPKNNIF